MQFKILPHGMRIDRVLFAWDGNPMFAGMFDLQERIYAKLGVQATLLRVGVDLPSRKDLPHSEKLNWQAPMALIWAGQHYPHEVVMTSGLDQVPLSRRFIDELQGWQYNPAHFVIGFAGCRQYEGHVEKFGCQYYPSSHMVAHGQTWQRVLAATPGDFGDFLGEMWARNYPFMWGHVATGWGYDEATISQLLAAHPEVPKFPLSPEFFIRWDCDRLGRASAPCDWDRLKNLEYSEIHLSRPYTILEKEIINTVYDQL